MREWWRHPVDRNWLLDFFDSRLLTSFIKAAIGIAAAILATAPGVAVFTAWGAESAAGRWVLAAIAIGSLAWALRWWLGAWPSLTVSAIFLVWGDLAISIACLLETNAVAGLGGSIALVLTGTYATFLHGPKMLAAHIAWSSLTVVALAVQVVRDPEWDPTLVVPKVVVALVAIVGLPPAMQFLFWLVRMNSVDSLIDPLTGLLNRRGLQNRTAALVAKGLGDEQVIAMIVVDLDRFKAVNDTHGHAAGDEVLIRTGLRIKSVLRSGAVLARLGGEEFAVVDVLPPEGIDGLAERIRKAIAAPADRVPVTASLGVAVTGNPACTRQNAYVDELFEDLLLRADMAMYRAKRNGRNSVFVDEPEDPVDA